MRGWLSLVNQKKKKKVLQKKQPWPCQGNVPTTAWSDYHSKCWCSSWTWHLTNISSAFIKPIAARVWSCKICGGQSGAGAGFLRVLRFPLPIHIPPIAPQSPSSIIWGLYNRPEVAAVPSGLSPTPLIKKKLSQFALKNWPSQHWQLSLDWTARNLFPIEQKFSRNILLWDYPALSAIRTRNSPPCK
jgi:hypothetical protein